ncbi:hypothetical protein Holit_02944 [Hollandina sp. SP2]
MTDTLHPSPAALRDAQELRPVPWNRPRLRDVRSATGKASPRTRQEDPSISAMQVKAGSVNIPPAWAASKRVPNSVNRAAGMLQAVCAYGAMMEILFMTPKLRRS